ncbi:hypothetical protein GYB14_09920 [bacterium]|nr:hypothetical protein [bacterium]
MPHVLYLMLRQSALRGQLVTFQGAANPRLAADFVYRKFVAGTPRPAISGKIKGVVGATIMRLINYDANLFLCDTIKKVIARKRAGAGDAPRAQQVRPHRVRSLRCERASRDERGDRR